MSTGIDGVPGGDRNRLGDTRLHDRSSENRGWCLIVAAHRRRRLWPWASGSRQRRSRRASMPKKRRRGGRIEHSGGPTDLGSLIVTSDRPVVGWFQEVGELHGAPASSTRRRPVLGWQELAGQARFIARRRDNTSLALGDGSMSRGGLRSTLFDRQCSGMLVEVLVYGDGAFNKKTHFLSCRSINGHGLKLKMKLLIWVSLSDS